MNPRTERAIQRMDYMKYGAHPLSLLGGFVLLVCGLFIGLLLVLNAVVPGGIARRITPATARHAQQHRPRVREQRIQSIQSPEGEQQQ